MSDPAANLRPETAAKLKRRVWLAAGGTGGHIYPALELGRALKEAAPELEIIYACGCRPGELEIYRARGIEPRVLPIAGRRGGGAGTLRFVADLLRAYHTIKPEMARARPDLAIGFGGYPSAPVLAAAHRLGAPIMIHEQNALPGAANRWLARRAERIFAGTELREGVFPESKVVLTGNPVRREIREAPDRDLARRELDLPADRRICLVFGGSLGARGVNRITRELLDRGAGPSGPLADWFFLWSTGPTQFDEAKAWLDSRPQLAGRVRAEPYLHRMELAYAAADVAICRSGALTLAELTILRKPAALIPLPTAAEGHQAENARVLERAGAAVVAEESDPAAAEKIARWLEQCSGNSAKLNQMSEAARGLARPDAAGAMTREILAFLSR